nr:MAG: hypothetical protein [Bacteriophage sp.]
MQFRSLFSKIFGNQKEYKDVTALKLLNGYTNMYTPFSGNAYDDATVRDWILLQGILEKCDQNM